MTVLDALQELPPVLVLTVVFLLPALEASALVGLVIPGETAAVLGGVLAHGGRLPLWAVAVAAAAGAVAGDAVGYRVGRRFGPALLDRLPRRMSTSGHVRRALELVRRRGAVAVILGRWTAALRALVPGVAGMIGVPARTFVAANVAGGITWAATMASLGFLAGAGYRTLERRLGLGELALLAVVLVLVAALLVRARRRRQPRR